MSHTYRATPPSFWLRLEWFIMVRIEGWVFSHRRRGLILRQIVALLDRAYSNRQKHVTVKKSCCSHWRHQHSHG
jgi:hypothetical protein